MTETESYLKGQIAAAESMINSVDECYSQGITINISIVEGILLAYKKQKQKELEEFENEQRA